MNADAFLCAVIFVAAPLRSGGTTAGHEAFPWSIKKKRDYPEVCQDLLHTAHACDDEVRNSEHFKTHKGMYSPVMEETKFHNHVIQCVEVRMTMADMKNICTDLRVVNTSLGCYQQSIHKSVPEEAQGITGELVGIFQDCIHKSFKPHNVTANSTVTT